MTNNLAVIEQHFRSNEQSFIRQASNWIQQAEDSYRVVLTQFLNPREQYILKSLINHSNELSIHFSGGTFGAESQRAIILPKGYPIDNLDFKLSLLEIDYSYKFVTLHHAMILGAILSSGVGRTVVGDILYDSDHTHWQVIVDSKMLNYIQDTVTQIGRTKVALVNRDIAEAMPVLSDWKEEFLLISSLRIDTVISAGFGLTRANTKNLIEENHVRMNWTEISKANVEVAIGDIISVRKYGRIQIKLLDGLSKKNKIKSIINIIRR